MSGEPDSATGGSARGDALARGLSLIGGASAAALFVLMVLITVDVVARYLFNSPIRGALEIADILMCAIIFAILPLACRRERHITVDLLDRVTPPPVLALQKGLVNVVSAALLAVVAWRMWDYAARLADYGDRTIYFDIPLYLPNYFISTMLGLAAVVFLANAGRAVARR